MVRDSLDRTVEQNQKPNQATEPQSRSQTSEEAAVPEQSQNSQNINSESKDPSVKQLDFLLWSKLSSEEEFESWRPPLTGAEADLLPTHLRTFSSAAEYQLVKHTYQQLQHSGYYWGPMTMEEAHEILTRSPQGTFLIRDSGQSDVFFTLSYQSEDKPTSVRIQLNDLLFSLCGSHRTFASLFALLAFYTSSICKLTEPYRRQRPERLKQMCRRALVHAYGAENTSSIPELSPQLKAYICAYPHSI
uniref:Suppressor of cytokine signaling 1b n=1 Tax=Iconisemion striatum TaxID=60296 RepID=A0A1A7WA15_9TELE